MSRANPTPHPASRAAEDHNKRWLRCFADGRRDAERTLLTNSRYRLPSSWLIDQEAWRLGFADFIQGKFLVWHGNVLEGHCETADDAWLLIHRKSFGASVDWLMKHEGWRIEEPANANGDQPLS